MQQGQQSAQSQTGTRDGTYNIISVVYHALQGAETIEKYKQDASGDEELSSFLDETQNSYRQLADRGKQLLQGRLQSGGQGSSAFGFGQGQREQGASAGQNIGAEQPSTTGETGGGSF